MRKLSIFFLFCIGLFVSSNFNIQAQTPAASPAPELNGIKANLASGEVTAKTDNKVSLKTTDGDIDVMIAATTVFKRVPGDKLDLKAAVDSNLSEVGVGDKVVVTGKVSEDKKTIPAAKQFILVTKSDLAKRVADEKAMWRNRGVFGKVVSVDFKTQQIVLSTSAGMVGEQKVTITPKENVSYKRYSPESEKYADAADSSFAEIKVGDQVRALGDKSEDGLNLKAEQVVSGAFKTVAGTITAIDLAKNEITIKELNNKVVTVVVRPTSQLKKFPAEMASMMAGRMGGGQPGQGNGNTVIMGPPQGGQPTGTTSTQTVKPGTGTDGGKTVTFGNPPAGGQPGTNGSTTTFGGPGGGPGGPVRIMRPGGGSGINDFFDNLPATSIAELKVGDQIGISSTSSVTTDRLTAIKLISGVGPFIEMSQRAAQMNNMRNAQNAPSVNIPGLDGGFGGP